MDPIPMLSIHFIGNLFELYVTRLALRALLEVGDFFVVDKKRGSASAAAHHRLAAVGHRRSGRRGFVFLPEIPDVAALVAGAFGFRDRFLLRFGALHGC